MHSGTSKHTYLFIVPFHNPKDWHTDYANQTAKILSTHHTVLGFLWGDAVSLKEIITRKKRYTPITRKGNLWYVQPLYLIPGKRILAVQYINLFINLIGLYVISVCLALYQSRTRVFWFFGIFDPVFTLLPAFFSRTKIFYDCVDVSAHPDIHIQKRFRQTERQLLKRAWIVTANSHVLLRRLKSQRPDTHLVPLGFRVEMFRTHKRPLSSNRTNQPVIGYIGAIDYRINISLLEHLVSHKSWRFIIVGPVFDDHLSLTQQVRLSTLLKKPNVSYSYVPYSSIPRILSSCNITIIPYKDTVFNRYAFPMKTMEYLYAQKRIIASDSIVELHAYTPLVLGASTIYEWEKCIRYALQHPLSTKEATEAKRIALQHTWNQKVCAQLHLLKHPPKPH